MRVERVCIIMQVCIVGSFVKLRSDLLSWEMAAGS